MKPIQQKIVSEKIAKDQAFVNHYMQEITSKKNLRVKAIDVAYSLLNQPRRDEEGKVVSSPPTVQEMIDAAGKIYEFINQDGGLENLEGSNIKLL